MENHAYTTLKNELSLLKAKRNVQQGKAHPNVILRMEKQIADLENAILLIKNHGK